MARAALIEDREILRAKFENVNRLLQVHEDAIVGIESRLQTSLTLQVEPYGAMLLRTTKRAMIPVSLAGINKGLIDGDLQAAKTELGEDFEELLADWVSKLTSASAILSAAPAGNPKPLSAYFDFIFATISLMRLSMRPAETLRNRLMHALNKQQRQPFETDGQYRRQMRDLRLRQLATQFGTWSPARILKLAQSDAVLQKLQLQSVKITLDIVRKALKSKRRFANRAASGKSKKYRAT